MKINFMHHLAAINAAALFVGVVEPAATMHPVTGLIYSANIVIGLVGAYTLGNLVELKK